jgi:hypothetical protein
LKSVALSLLVLVAAAQPAAPGKDAEYLALAGAAVPDWCRVRALYPDTSFYAEHLGIEAKKKTAEAGQRLLMDKTAEAAAAFQDHMRRHAGSVGAHFYAAYLYDWNADLAGQKMDRLLPDFGHGVDYIDPAREKKAAAALLGCIVSAGDGRSAASAFEVISVEEEEIVIEKYFHVDPVRADAHRENGKFYNVVTVTIPDSKVETDIYFRLDPRLVQGLIARQKETKAKAAAKP